MTTQTLHRADYAYSEAAEHLNLPTATIIDMVNSGTLEHTACGKRITRDSLQAAMAPESERKWLHGKKPGGHRSKLYITVVDGNGTLYHSDGCFYADLMDISFWRAEGPELLLWMCNSTSDREPTIWLKTENPAMAKDVAYAMAMAKTDSFQKKFEWGSEDGDDDE